MSVKLSTTYFDSLSIDGGSSLEAAPGCLAIDTQLDTSTITTTTRWPAAVTILPA